MEASHPFLGGIKTPLPPTGAANFPPAVALKMGYFLTITM
jgi:hypothetical protein